MRVTIYHEATKLKREFKTIKEMRDYAANRHANSNDFDDYVKEGGKMSEIGPYDVAWELFGSWGRVLMGSENDYPSRAIR